MKIKKHGNTQDCLDDYLREAHNDITEIVKFVYVQRRSVGRWTDSEKGLPTGGNLLRLQYFLIYSGYKLTEFDGLSKDLIDLGHCWVLGIVTIQELIQKQLIDRPERLFPYFQSTRTFSSEKMGIVKQIVSEHYDELKKRLAPSTSESSSVVASESVELEDSILKLQEACQSIKKLSDQFLVGSKEDRIKMRNRLGTGEKPVLHEAWKATRSLLAEETVYEKVYEQR